MSPQLKLLDSSLKANYTYSVETLLVTIPAHSALVILDKSMLYLK